MADFHIVQGDLLPSIQVVCEEPDPDTGGMRPCDLTGATAVFKMAPVGCHTPVLGGDATVVGDGREALVQYDWQLADTKMRGQYHATVVATLPGGKKKTFPNNGYLLVEVFPSL